MPISNQITPIIRAVAAISANSIREIVELVEYLDVTKGLHITTAGQQDNWEYFILDGICKSYLFTPEGEDITISFFMAPSIVSPSTMRNKAGKSMLNIRALSDMKIARFDADKFEQLMVDNLEIRDFGNTVLRNELMQKVQKEIGMASLKGKDRLIALRSNFPNIENLVSHSDIASYLGITTISLSRLRSKS